MRAYAEYDVETSTARRSVACGMNADPTQWWMRPPGTVMIPFSRPGRAGRTPSRLVAALAPLRIRERKASSACFRYASYARLVRGARSAAAIVIRPKQMSNGTDTHQRQWFIPRHHMTRRGGPARQGGPPW